jgi:hypothetical protein
MEWSRVWSVEYGVWSMEYGVWSMKYGVWRMERMSGVWVECERSVE